MLPLSLKKRKVFAQKRNFKKFLFGAALSLEKDAEKGAARKWL